MLVKEVWIGKSIAFFPNQESYQDPENDVPLQGISSRPSAS
jgi:hypothetical protein